MSLELDDTVSPIWWTPEDQEGQDAPAEFNIRPLTGPELLEVQQHFVIVNGEGTVTGPGLIMACRKGLIGWRNIFAKEGKEAKFTRSSADKLPADIIAGIGAKSINLSSVSGDEEGN